MKTIKISIVLITIISLTACKKGPLWGVRGKGSNVTNTINLNGFDKIDLNIDAEVTYTQDSIYKVEITAQQNIQDVLQIFVDSNTLKIKTNRNLWDHKKIEVIVHSPNIYALSISGSGNISATNTLTTNSLEITVSGSGSISVPSVITQQLNGKISGSGDIHLSGGTTVNENFHISGSGNVDVLSVQSENTTANISGSGNLKTWVLQNLNVNISGSGSVRYKGYPSVTTDISGAGKVVHIN